MIIFYDDVIYTNSPGAVVLFDFTRPENCNEKYILSTYERMLNYPKWSSSNWNALMDNLSNLEWLDVRFANIIHSKINNGLKGNEVRDIAYYADVAISVSKFQNTHGINLIDFHFSRDDQRFLEGSILE